MKIDIAKSKITKVSTSNNCCKIEPSKKPAIKLETIATILFLIGDQTKLKKHSFKGISFRLIEKARSGTNNNPTKEMAQTTVQIITVATE